MTYHEFLQRKTQLADGDGFDPVWMPDSLYPFQRDCVEWACHRGRAALFEDCGLGKTPQQLVWAENVVRKTGGRVLVLTPLAVAFQTEREAAKFDIEAVHRRDELKRGDGIVITNYERLHHFEPGDFQGVVCDESSILKNFDGATRKAITEFMRTRPYRLLCTATAAPNDYIELGTSSEALGELGNQDMLNRFFKRGKTFVRKHAIAGQGWDMRPHAEHDFWRWVVSWARAIRKPSDLGYDDGAFRLPDLQTRQHVVKANSPRDGYLFDIPAVGLSEQRDDLRRTLDERCRMVADLVNSHTGPAVCWTNLNAEADTITRLVNGAVNVQGSDSDDAKEAAFRGFADGSIRVIVSKPSIAGFGLNWQHCAHMTFFPSHSYEQYYQCVRRCWRFGQQYPVTVDMITTDGQENVLANMQNKADAAAKMFERLVAMMANELSITRKNEYTQDEEIPKWL